MREVETEAIIGNQRSLLRHMPAQRVAQGSVNKVRCRVVGPDAIPPAFIYFKMDRVT